MRSGSEINRNLSLKPRIQADDDDDESKQSSYSSDESASSAYSSSTYSESEASQIEDTKLYDPVSSSTRFQCMPTAFHPSRHQTSSAATSFSKLRKFELFSTAQCYYLIASDKAGTAFRVLKMDRTLIEHQTPMDTSGSIVSIGSPSSNFPLLYALPPPPPPPPLSSHHAASDVVSSVSTVSDHKRMTSSTLDDQHSLKPTLRPLGDFCFEDPVVYSAAEIHDMLDMIQDGNKHHKTMPQATGGNSRPSGQGDELKPLVKACGIVGFIRFLDCYYLTLITAKSKVGNIAGNVIYTIKNTETLAIKPVERDGNGLGVLDDPSSMLLNMWNRGKRSLQLGLSNRELAELRYQQLFQVIDLQKDFFYSYTYDLTRSLQENMGTMSHPTYPAVPIKDMYCWNYYLTRDLENITGGVGSSWILPIIHGAFLQRKIMYGRTLNLILLARRSRHFAGTRYLKRGVSDQGKVANDVEHEQILHDESSGVSSAYLQMRGSIPTYWTQETSVTMPKPPIVLNRVDPNYTSTQNHFTDLFKRYGSPIVVVDLVKQSERREREVIVGNEFRHSIEYLNAFIDDEHKIRYCALDYSHVSKHRNLDVSSALHEVACWAVNQTGFFCSNPKWKLTPKGFIEPVDASHNSDYADGSSIEQTGVMRTNCIDCLDRTNVAQFSAGVEALSQQLVVMGIRSLATNLDPTSNIVKAALIDMYVEIGDHISLQYGGSEAHKKVQSSGAAVAIQVPTTGKHKELLTSIRRYYSNAFTDRLKQDAINLFLGYYVPSQHLIPLWELENDYYLHNMHVKTGKESVASIKFHHQNFVNDWDVDDNDGKDETGSKMLTTMGKQSSADSVDLSKDSCSTITRVRLHCENHKNTRTFWWKDAIKSYLDQRQKYTAGAICRNTQSNTHRIDKLSEFDKIFFKAYEIPMRLSHAAQHTILDEDKEQLQVHRNLSKFPMTLPEDGDSISVKNPIDDRIILGDFLHRNDFRRNNAPLLSTFLDSRSSSYRHHRIVSHNAARCHDKESDEEGVNSANFVGEFSRELRPPQDYTHYTEKLTVNPLVLDFRHNHQEELKRSLHESNLDSDDVDGILRLSQSSHICREIRVGPYRGVNSNESAVAVSAAVYEQLNTLDRMKSRGELSGERGLPGVDDFLKRRGMDNPGVMDAIFGSWSRFSKSEQIYREVSTQSLAGNQRSDFSDEKSLKLYCSHFPSSSQLSAFDMALISSSAPANSNPDSSAGVNKAGGVERRASAFTMKAKQMGYNLLSFNSPTGESTSSLFMDSSKYQIPQGFEQINDDLYARIENKFLVFNAAGLCEWPPVPVTKIR